MADIELPQLGESVTEGTITRWFKAVGDQVAEDEPLFEVSTDKVDSEVPSPVSGTLTEILVEEGDTVDVGTKLAVVSAGDGQATTAPASDPASEPEPEAPPEAAAEPAGEPAARAEPEPAGEPAARAEPEPAAEPAARAEPAPPVAGPPPRPAAPEAAPPAEPAPTPEPAAAAAPEPPTDGAGGAGADGLLLSPVVRRLVEDAGVDPAQIAGTGVGGRVTRTDVERHLADRAPAPAAPATAASGPAAPTPTAPPPAATTSASAGARPAAPAVTVAHGSDTRVPFNKIRKITAEHMVRSLDTSAHAYVSVEVDYQAVERVRTAHRARFKAEEGTSLTYLPFVSRALVDAIAEFPKLNATVGDGELVLHGDVNLGVAVDLNDEGLIVPVVHGAQDKRLRAIAREVAELADRARNRGLSADDITGGTVTITNIGFTGNVILLPIINQPQVMILSTDGIRRRPVVVTDESGSESIAIHSVGNLTLGWDHRAFDGAYAARFLARVREILEMREWEAEL